MFATVNAGCTKAMLVIRCVRHHRRYTTFNDVPKLDWIMDALMGRDIPDHIKRPDDRVGSIHSWRTAMLAQSRESMAR